MTCRQHIDFLSDYLEGTLPDATRRQFDAHLDGCTECRRYMKEFKTTVELVGSTQTGDEAPLPELPRELVKAIVQACKRP